MPNDPRRIEEGMLWWDDSDRSLEEKIQRAVDYYQEKYDEKATGVVVNLDELEDVEVGDLELSGSTAVMPNHFWIGQFKGTPVPGTGEVTA